ncbi:hypothetical protein A9174_14745 [Mesorhizobium loti NZP2037]|uniref:hypothetical protein n=1 Tax=Mesorhizobium sp. 131-3-5 TaxID=2744520 RepID=UPI0003A5F681|nr:MULTISPECIES: hypothetical protein [Mesorhizobium]ANN57891.1 hypothetical protein A9174_14745 [Mesorhizobium loti NZP2037]
MSRSVDDLIGSFLEHRLDVRSASLNASTFYPLMGTCSNVDLSEKDARLPKIILQPDDVVAL